MCEEGKEGCSLLLDEGTQRSVGRQTGAAWGGPVGVARAWECDMGVSRGGDTGVGGGGDTGVGGDCDTGVVVTQV